MGSCARGRADRILSAHRGKVVLRGAGRPGLSGVLLSSRPVHGARRTEGEGRRVCTMTEAAILRSTLQILTARGVIYQDGRHEKQCEICGRAFAVKKSRLAVARFCSQ